MKHRQRMSFIAIVLGILVIAVVVFAVFQNAPTAHKATITLTHRSTNQPFAKQKIQFSSVDALTACPASIGSGCKSEAPKVWEGTTDTGGRFRVPASFIQQRNTVFVWHPEYDSGKGGWEPVAHFDSNSQNESSNPISAQINP